MKPTKAQVVATALSLTLLASVAGCSEEFAVPMKGVYMGAADQPLDETTLKELRSRSRYQSFN